MSLVFWKTVFLSIGCIILILCFYFVHSAVRMQNAEPVRVSTVSRNKELSRRRLEKIKRINMGL